MTKRILILITLTGILFFAASAQELVLNSGHTDIVNSVALSPDGKYVLSGSRDKTIKLWDVATGKEIKTLRGHSEAVECVAFSPDGKYIVSGGGSIVDSELKLWDANSGRIIRNFNGHTMTVYGVAFSPDGKYLLTGSADFKVKLWEVATGQLIKTFEGHKGWVFSVAFSPDGELAISASNKEKMLILWDIEKGKEVRSFKPYASKTLSANFSPNGEFVISGSTIYSVPRGKEVINFPGTKQIGRVANFSPDGKMALTSFFEKSFTLWDVSSGKKLKTFTGHKDEVTSVVFSDNGHYILSGSKDKTLRLWAVESGQEIRTFTGQSPNFYSFAFAGAYTLRNRTSKENKAVEFVRQFTGVEWIETSTDGKFILYTTSNNTIKLYEIATGKDVQEFTGHSGSIFDVSFSPDGKYMLSGSQDRTMKLWDISSGKLVKTYTKSRDYTEHQNRVASVAFGPNGKYLASGSYDETVKIWDINSGEVLHTLKGHSSFVLSIAFTHDGKTIASGSLDKTVILWDVVSGQKLKTFTGHLMGVNTIAISPDNKYLLSGSDGNLIKLWEMSTGTMLKTFTGHTNEIRKLAFSPGGKYFLSCSKDGITKLWNMQSKECLATYWALSKDKWACYTPGGKFDGSEEGYNLFHFVKNTRVIPLESLFEQYYAPNLMDNILGGAELKKEKVKIQELKAPPEVQIESPIHFAKLDQKDAIIRIKVIDQGGGIDEVRLFHNNKLIETSGRGFKKIGEPGKTVTKTFNIQLVNGKNHFKTTAFNNQRVESVPNEIIVFYEGQKPKSNLHILAVGINQYKNPKYNLNYAVKDAQGFVEQIKTGSGDIFGEVKTYFIQDDEALKLSIMNKLKEVKTRAKQEDVVVFYYAGHGVMSEGSSVTSPEFFLIPHDVTQLYGNDEMLNEKAISAGQLMELSKEIKAQKQLFVFDACQSGGAMQAFAMRGAAEEKAMAQLARSAGIVVLSASGSEQFATEFNDLGHGTFTYALIEGLQCQADGGTKDRKITVNELKAWIEDRVPELTEKYKGTAQYPTGYSRGQDFPIVICK